MVNFTCKPQLPLKLIFGKGSRGKDYDEEKQIEKGKITLCSTAKMVSTKAELCLDCKGYGCLGKILKYELPLCKTNFNIAKRTLNSRKIDIKFQESCECM